jgi:hypothetical protein
MESRLRLSKKWAASITYGRNIEDVARTVAVPVMDKHGATICISWM